MLQRSHIRHLLVVGLAVALTTHLWMLNDPMRSGATVDVGAAAATPAEGVLAAPAPMGGAEAPDMPFMALTCLAILLALVAAVAPGGSLRRQRVERDTAKTGAGGRLERVLAWPLASPPPSRVDAGVLLLV